MKKTFFAAMLLLAFVAYSCTPKEEVTPSDKSIVNDGSIVFAPTATIEDFVFDGPATKTTVAFDGENAPEFTFEASDILGVYPYTPQQGDQVRFKVKESSTAWAAFDGQGFGLKSGQLYAAYYPADIANAAAEKMTAIPVDYTGQRQTGKTTYGIAKADYLVANNVTPENNACSFSMHHVGALLVMDITFPEAGNYSAITLTSEGTPFVVEGKMDLTDEEIAVEAEGTEATVTLALGEEGGSGLAIAANETVRFCMMVAPANLKNSKVTLAAGSGSVQFASFKEFKAGKAYKVTCTLGQEAPAEPIDLGANGTANTYIVSVAGDYFFNATVAGNGASGIVDFPSAFLDAGGLVVPASGTYALSGNGVRLHWAQNNCITDVTYSDGAIYFKATGNKGNAKVSLTSGENGTGDNVWTWIIWCTDKPGVVTYSAPTSPNNSFTVLDRNMGAITNGPIESGHSAEEMSGLYYQWGNPIGYTVAEFMSMRNNDAWRMVDAFNNPTKPLTRTTDWVWFNPCAGAVGANVMGCLWGSGPQSGFLGVWPSSSFYKKTIYDPCPVGYKVAPVDFLRTYEDTNNTYTNQITADCFGMYIQGNDGTVFFPYTGRIGFSGTSATSASWLQNPFSWPAGDNGYGFSYWTSCIAGDGNRGFNIAWTWQASQRNETRVSYGETTSTNKFVSQGNAVRCIAE